MTLSHKEKILGAIGRGGGQTCYIHGVARELEAAGFAIIGLRPIAEAPQDGREVLVTDGQIWRVAVPKQFGNKWEYHRDERHAPGHTWSIEPTHFISLGDLPTKEPV